MPFTDNASNQKSEPTGYSYERLKAEGWPVDFDFETDHTCQTVFKPFIDEQLKILEAYDDERDLVSTYVFHQHALDAADDVKNTCLALGLGDRVSQNMYYATLIHDIGKPELPADIWDYDGTVPADVKTQKRQHVGLGRSIMEERFDSVDHPFKDLAIDIIHNHHERMDGTGENNVPGEQLSMPVRLVCIVEDYDGRTHLRPHHVEAGRTNDAPSVFEHMEEKMAGAFDPHLYAAFKQMKLDQYQRSLDSAQDLSNSDIEDDEPVMQ